MADETRQERIMKQFDACIVLSASLLLAACSKEPDMKSSVSELEKAFPAPAAVQPAASQPAAAPQGGPADANELVQSALAAARANDYAGGVIALQTAQTRPGITADQVAALQNAKHAMVQELQRRAINGDQQALNQLKAIERSRSQ